MKNLQPLKNLQSVKLKEQIISGIKKYRPKNHFSKRIISLISEEPTITETQLKILKYYGMSVDIEG